MEKIKQRLSVHIILSKDFVEEYHDYLALSEFVYEGGELFILPTAINQKIKNSRFILLDHEQMLYQCHHLPKAKPSGIKEHKSYAKYFVNAYTDYFLKLERCSENVYY